MAVNILKTVLNIKHVFIERTEEITEQFEAYGLEQTHTKIIIHVRPIKRMQGLCPICKKKCVKDGHKHQEKSTWRTNNLGGYPTYIKYRPQRILCPIHGALNEYIPWADGNSRFTETFNNEVAWLVCQMSKSAISEFLEISWQTVGNCVKAAQKRIEPHEEDRIHDDVRRISVDETSFKKGHKYLTIVTDLDKNRVIWVGIGHSIKTFLQFCKKLTQKEREKIEIVAGDGAKWIDACMKYFPNATRCIDPFHVTQWLNKALDDIRKSTLSKAKAEYKKQAEEFRKAEEAAKQAEKENKEKYKESLKELKSMPHRGRPSKHKQELQTFVEEYEKRQRIEKGKALPKKVGRPKKGQLSLEYDVILKELENKQKLLSSAKFALGHNPENCTDGHINQIQLIQSNYPDLYKGYQLKESARIILHMTDREQASIALEKWINDALNSGLKAMQKLAEKIRDRHRDNILNSIEYKANSAKSEATNTTVKGLMAIARG